MAAAACGDERTETVKQRLIEAFRRYGLPEMLITDNGSPWGDGPASRFTPLGVWLLEQDIAIAHSRPYHPQTMGKDERFHRSLKAEVLSGAPFGDLGAAERALADWRDVYNQQRPHEALALAVPASHYVASRRDYSEQPAPFEYGCGDIVRQVQEGGWVSLLSRKLRLPKAFRGKTVAFRPTSSDGVYEAFFRAQPIATVDIRTAPYRRPKSVHDVSEHLSTLSPA